MRTPYATFVGPDNGVFTPFFRDRIACVALTNPATQLHPVSATFHGRDIFAPVAAHLAIGFALHNLGSTVEAPVSVPEPQPERLAMGRLRGEVVHVDHFGNMVTNVRPSKREAVDPSRIRIVVQGLTLPVRHTYADVEPDALVALVGSGGFLEIAVREGSAAKRLGLGVGAEVEVQGL
jgi:S-adenosylmethionine hydrolase